MEKGLKMKGRLKLFSIVSLIGLFLVFPLSSFGATDGGYDLTSSLWAKAVLQIPGFPVTLKWKVVGTDITPSGDQVISGYFYADPNDFAYGSQYNPEIFVKIYIATSGWCNIAFNHVTVDDVTVYSAHQYAGEAQQTEIATLTSRLVEHQYSGVAIQNTPQTNGTLAPSTTGSGYIMTSGLWAKAILQPPNGQVTLIWKEVGSDMTPSGDHVVSGYFYADPGDFVYGSEFNPEVFVKIYIAKSGWCNIAFNHVTVDNVAIFSAHNYSGTVNQTGTASLATRLIEDQYDGVRIDSENTAAYYLYDEGVFDPGYQISFSMAGSSNFGDIFTGTVIMATRSQIILGAQAVIPQEALVSITNTKTGASVSTIATSYFNMASLNPVQMEIDGIIFSPTTISNLPYTAEVGDFGKLTSYVGNNGDTIAGTWFLEDAGENQSNLVQQQTYKYNNGNVFYTAKAIITIDKNGAPKKYAVEYYYPSNGLRMNLSGNRT